MTTVIDGKKIAHGVRSKAADDVASYIATGEPAPTLATILVGDEPRQCRIRRQQAPLSVRVCQVNVLQTPTRRAVGDTPKRPAGTDPPPWTV